MTSYHFSCGDSTDGPIGLCARVDAADEDDALKQLRSFLEAVAELQLAKSSTVTAAPGLDYCNVYINPEAVTVADIDEVGDGS